MIRGLMALEFPSLHDLPSLGFDAIIDVRSPAEYALDHIPGAINLPALSNAERAEIGTIYKQISPFSARKKGAALVARNVADHLSGPLADMPGAWRPLVYCWRGGQRSGSFASILTQIGWRAEVIKGGYQSYRRLVQSTLYDTDLPHRIVLLDGYTGTAKTDLLHRLSAAGAQTIDLEGLARHRGSLLGAHPSGQPAQKAFESGLAAALAACDPARPTLIEAESSKIGRINLPTALWQKMIAAPRIVVSADLAQRARYLARTYADTATNLDTLRARLAPLRRVRGHAMVESWLALFDQGDHTGFAAAIMRDHYDPAYARSRKIDTRDVLASIAVASLDDAGLSRAADQIKALLGAR